MEDIFQSFQKLLILNTFLIKFRDSYKYTR